MANEPYEIPRSAEAGTKILDEPQAIRWVEELILGVQFARRACDARVPDDFAKTVKLQREAERTWLLRHGAALGTIAALYRTGLLGDVAYAQLRKQVMETMLPTVVGGVRG